VLLLNLHNSQPVISFALRELTTGPLEIILKITALILVVLLAPSLAPTTQRNAPHTLVYDGFESPDLSQEWETSRFVPGAVAIETHTVRAGRSAIQVTIHSGEKFEAGINGNADSERAELTEARRLTSRQELPYEYSFSMFFPADFPIVPVRLVVAQWKQACLNSDLPCSDDSPVLAVRYINGELQITQDLEHKRNVLYREKSELRSRWLDLRFQARFTPQRVGRIRAWLNDRQIIEYTGQTANQESTATGYPDPSWFFFKMGLYRNVMKAPMTVYIDEYRKRMLDEGEL
jgi:hypothetical protein